jgi:hypothetical protein
MPESSLTIAFRELQAELGQFLGYGRGTYYGGPPWTDPATGNAGKQQTIDSATKSGLRRFYFSAMFPGIPIAYNWSFLKPTATLDLPIGAGPNGYVTVRLPDDFGGLEDDGSILLASQALWLPIHVYGEGMVRQKYSEFPTLTGQPTMVAVVPIKGTGFESGQRFELLFYPVPDQEYTIQFAYRILPDCLSGALPYCYGGAQHSETILEACKAAAERNQDDAVSVHEEHYQQLLAASISYDRNLKPQRLGYCGDGSEERRWTRRDLYQNQTVTFAGVLPT